ncbi:unnamed protein product [Paramecium sonneborni]|uniref:Transmembrane protein n=1 Tax=Paramecium sonneborni TaxID=65129 RepID=A0A8S1RRN6_9CILI|nr:unnamed protein product [Paramecium sonneborni]
MIKGDLFQLTLLLLDTSQVLLKKLFVQQLHNTMMANLHQLRKKSPYLTQLIILRTRIKNQFPEYRKMLADTKICKVVIIMLKKIVLRKNNVTSIHFLWIFYIDFHNCTFRQTQFCIFYIEILLDFVNFICLLIFEINQLEYNIIKYVNMNTSNNLSDLGHVDYILINKVGTLNTSYYKLNNLLFCQLFTLNYDQFQQLCTKNQLKIENPIKFASINVNNEYLIPFKFEKKVILQIYNQVVSYF